MRRITDPAQLAEYRRSFVPAGTPAQCHRSKRGEAIAYTWTQGGKLIAVGWMGKSMHPFSRSGGQGSIFRFSTEKARRDFVADMFSRAASWAERKAKDAADAAAARAIPHGLQVGDVLRASWGYDQTNIDWYEVTKLVGSTMVEIRRIRVQSSETGWLTGECTPVRGAYIGEPKRRRVSGHGKHASVSATSCSIASLVEPTIVGGVRCYPPANWSAYA